MTKPYSPRLSLELIAEVAACVRKGNFRYVAMQRAGMHPETFRRWMARGTSERKKLARQEEPGEPSLYVLLVDAMEKAEGDAHAQGVEDVMSSGDPKLVLKFLTLRYNKLYNKNPNARVDDETGEEQKIDAKALLREKINALLDA